MSAKQKWLLYAVGGLVLFGFGLSLLGEEFYLNTISQTIG